MLVYEPAGTLIALARSAESVCSFVKSTVMLLATSGMLTAVPDVGVRVTPVIVALKESSEVTGGGVRGVAVRLMLTVALPGVPGDPPLPPLAKMLGPLHDVKATARRPTANEKSLRSIRHPPRQGRLRLQNPSVLSDSDSILTIRRRGTVRGEKWRKSVQLLNQAGH